MSQEGEKAFTRIPIIDLSNATSPSPELRKSVADEIKKACMEVGFFYVKNHKIPQAVFTNTLQSMKDFFRLPLDDKMVILNKKSQAYKGYSPLLSGNNNPKNQGDLQEGFEFSYEPISPPPDWNPETSPLGANQWPSDCPGFRQSALEYYYEALKLGTILFPLFALALDLPENWFEDKTKGNAALMRLLYYPTQEPRPRHELGDNENVIGIGSHTDWECFTILFQQPGITALQVLNSKKEWIDAPPIEGALVINLGDQLARWTNDKFKSTIHRAINTSGSERYSIPLFFGTDYDVLLEPIPGTGPATYEIITAGQYIKAKLKETYGHT